MIKFLTKERKLSMKICEPRSKMTLCTFDNSNGAEISFNANFKRKYKNQKFALEIKVRFLTKITTYSNATTEKRVRFIKYLRPIWREVEARQMDEIWVHYYEI